MSACYLGNINDCHKTPVSQLTEVARRGHLICNFDGLSQDPLSDGRGTVWLVKA